MGKNKEKIIKIEKNCAKWFNRGELEKILNHFDKNIFGFSSTKHEKFYGKEELQKTFEYYLSEGEELEFTLKDLQVDLITKSLAICTFYWQVTLRAGSKVTEIPGRASHVYHKTKGNWKIVHEHFSKAH
jgi:ketosteroid isomerase-like protein